MTEYETIYITQSDLNESGVQTLSDKLRAIFGKDGKKADAQYLTLRDWGVRKLAYEIGKQKRGHYFYLNYLGDGRLVTEVERNLRFDEKVFRFLTIQVGKVDDIAARVEAVKTQKAGSIPQAEEIYPPRTREHSGHGGEGYSDDMIPSEEELV